MIFALTNDIMLLWTVVESEFIQFLCGYGGIGRRVGLRIRWETVQVQVLLSAPKQYNPNQILLVGDGVRIICLFREIRGHALS